MWSEGEAEADAKHLSRADRVGTHIGHHFVADGAYVDGLAILQPGTGQLFLDPSAFPFVSSLEASWHHVRDEFEALPHDAFDPWVQRSMHGEGWSIYGLFVAGERIEGACRNCPRTAELIGRIDGVYLLPASRAWHHDLISSRTKVGQKAYTACTWAWSSHRIAGSGSAPKPAPGMRANAWCSTIRSNMKRGMVLTGFAAYCCLIFCGPE